MDPRLFLNLADDPKAFGAARHQRDLLARQTLQVRTRDQCRVRPINQLGQRLRRHRLHQAVQHLPIERFIGTLTGFDGTKQRNPFAIDKQGEQELLQIRSVGFGMAVRRLDAGGVGTWIVAHERTGGAVPMATV